MLNKQVLIVALSLSLTLYASSLPSQTPTYQDYQELSKREAQKNPTSYIEKAQAGVSVTLNSSKECEVIGIEKGSPGYRADLRIGDIIVSVDGVKINDRKQLFKIYDGKNPGETISGEIRRNGKILKKDIILDSFYIPHDIYVLNQELSKDIPVRLAILIDDVSTYPINPRTEAAQKKEIASLLYTQMENAFIQFCQAQSNCSIIDRQKISIILNELKFQSSNLVSDDLRTQIGQLSGATHLLIVGFTTYSKPKNRLAHHLRRRLVEVQTGKVLSSLLFVDEINP